MDNQLRRQFKFETSEIPQLGNIALGDFIKQIKILNGNVSRLVNGEIELSDLIKDCNCEQMFPLLLEAISSKGVEVEDDIEQFYTQIWNMYVEAKSILEGVTSQLLSISEFETRFNSLLPQIEAFINDFLAYQPDGYDVNVYRTLESFKAEFPMVNLQLNVKGIERGELVPTIYTSVVLKQFIREMILASLHFDAKNISITAVKVQRKYLVFRIDDDGKGNSEERWNWESVHRDNYVAALGGLDESTKLVLTGTQKNITELPQNEGIRQIRTFPMLVEVSASEMYQVAEMFKQSVNKYSREEIDLSELIKRFNYEGWVTMVEIYARQLRYKNVNRDIISAYAHNGRNPLSTIKSVLNLMKDEVTAESMGYEDTIGVMHRAINDIFMEFIEDVHDFDPDNVCADIRQLWPRIASRFKGRGRAIVPNFNDLPNEDIYLGYPVGYLKEQVRELIANAEKHRASVVYVKFSLVNNKLTIRVSDNGEGVTKARAHEINGNTALGLPSTPEEGRINSHGEGLSNLGGRIQLTPIPERMKVPSSVGPGAVQRLTIELPSLPEEVEA